MLANKPTVYIPRHVYQQIMHWVNRAEGEVGGMGTVHFSKKYNYFYVDRVFLLEQEVTGGSTDLCEKALGKLETQLIKEGIEGDLNFWWHSHSNFGVFWSQQDRETINMLGGQGYCVATVFNKKNEMKSAVEFQLDPKAVNSDFDVMFNQAGTVFGDDLKTVIYDQPPTEDQIKAWNEDFDAKVKEKKYKAPAVVKGSSTTQKNGTTTTDSGTRAARPNSKSWGCPTADKVAQVFAEWRRMYSGFALQSADKDTIICAAATTFNMAYFNYIEEAIDLDQWGELDTYVRDFKANNPNFDWSIN